ncbi:MAG: RDD family protein [Nocardioides sp.]|nr:RDD family protein [Nocardioides sp.]
MSESRTDPRALPFETASWLRRILALVVDWTASTLVVVAILGPTGWSDSRWSGFDTLAIFVFQSTLLMALVGGSFGQLATRLRVVRTDGSGRPLSVPGALLRQVLVVLVIPPLIFRPDGRGLHDMAVGSATVTLETALRGVS